MLCSSMTTTVNARHRLLLCTWIGPIPVSSFLRLLIITSHTISHTLLNRLAGTNDTPWDSVNVLQSSSNDTAFTCACLYKRGDGKWRKKDVNGFQNKGWKQMEANPSWLSSIHFRRLWLNTWGHIERSRYCWLERRSGGEGAGGSVRSRSGVIATKAASLLWGVQSGVKLSVNWQKAE